MNQISYSHSSANSASCIITCRFKTVPPIPPLKAAIAISQDWPIEHLISKIHQTILEETADEEYFHLLETTNPSHRLVLELSDGCRVPIHEPCTIIEKEQILTVRLAPKLPISFTLSDRIQRPNVSSQSYYPLLLPSPINASERFSSHVASSTHHLNNSSIIPNRKSNPPIPSNNISLLSKQGIIQVGPSDQPNQLTCIQHHPTTLSGSRLSSQAYDAIHDPSTYPLSESPAILPADTSTSSNARRFMPVLKDPPSTHDKYPHPANAPPTYRLFNLDPNAHFQTNELVNHSLPQPSISSQDNHSIPTEQEPLAAPFQSNSQDLKPTQQDLDESLQLSDNAIPRVRSHIAGLRKVAIRHYNSNSSSSASNGGEFLDGSDESISFSRYAQEFRSKDNKRKKRSSKASKQPGLSNKNSRRRPPSPKQKSLPTRCSSDDSIKEIGSLHSSPKIVQDDDALKMRRVNPELASLPISSNKNSCPRPHPTQSSHSTCSRHLAKVRVVIPHSPSLLSFTQHKTKYNKMEVESKLGSESAPLGSQDQSTTSNSDLSNSSQLGQEVSISPQLDRNSKSPSKINSTVSHRETRSMYRIDVDDNLFKAASSKGPITIPYSISSGLNGRSTLREVIRRLELDFNSSWKMIIGDKVWMSDAALKRIKSRGRSWGLLDGRIVQLDFDLNLKSLGVFPIPNPQNKPSLRIQVIRNWNLESI